MATKKQKREAALDKRARMMEEEKDRGLEAQRQDKGNQAVQNQLLKAEADRINQKHRDILQKAFNS